MLHYSSALLLALLAVAVPSQTNAACTNAQVSNGDDIVSKICDSDEDDRFGTLCDLLRETNLDDSINPSGDFFLFAPNNQAFNRAGRTAGVTRAQKVSTLQYHVSNNDADLVCGTTRSSLLFIAGQQQTSITRCNNNAELVGQEGNVNLPVRGSVQFPSFVDPSNFIDACNGKIAEIGDVMGWGTPVYNYGVAVLGQPCSFYSKSCKAGKGGAGVLVVSDPTQQGSLVFDNVYYRPRGKVNKGSYGRWSNLNQWQSIYAVNAPGVFGPNYFAPYYQGKHSKHHKGGKGGYGYRRPYYGPRATSYYVGGYYARPRRGRRGNWFRGRELDAENGDEVEGHLRGAAAAHRYSDYEPSDYEEEEEEYRYYDMEYESEDQ